MNIKRKLRDIDYLPKGLQEYTENDLADMLEIFNETALTGVNSPVTGPVSIEELGFYLNYPIVAKKLESTGALNDLLPYCPNFLNGHSVGRFASVCLSAS